MLVSFFFMSALLAGYASLISYSPHAAVYFMIVSFMSTGILYYLLGATYFAIMFFIVYVGAIAMLFVFCTILFDFDEFSDRAVERSISSFYVFLFVIPVLLFVISWLFDSSSIITQVGRFGDSVQITESWSFVTKDQLFVTSFYTTFLPYISFFGFILFLVTVIVTVVLS